MIIICPSCKKRFNVKDEYIHESGRTLKCGSCGEEWFFFKVKEKNQNVSENVGTSTIKKQQGIKKQIYTEETSVKSKEKLNNNKENKVEKLKVKSKSNRSFNLISYTVVILISFIALIIVIDTFKLHIANILPGLIPMLDNLYQVLIDVYLFLKDLFT